MLDMNHLDFESTLYNLNFYFTDFIIKQFLELLILCHTKYNCHQVPPYVLHLKPEKYI